MTEAFKSRRRLKAKTLRNIVWSSKNGICFALTAIAAIAGTAYLLYVLMIRLYTKTDAAAGSITPMICVIAALAFMAYLCAGKAKRETADLLRIRNAELLISDKNIQVNIINNRYANKIAGRNRSRIQSGLDAEIYDSEKPGSIRTHISIPKINITAASEDQATGALHVSFGDCRQYTFYPIFDNWDKIRQKIYGCVIENRKRQKA